MISNQSRNEYFSIFEVSGVFVSSDVKSQSLNILLLYESNAVLGSSSLKDSFSWIFKDLSKCADTD